MKNDLHIVIVVILFSLFLSIFFYPLIFEGKTFAFEDITYASIPFLQGLS